MTPALQNRVQRVALRARRLVRLHGIGWFLAAACGIGIAFGWLDYLLRFQDAGVRWIISAGVLLLVVWCFLRHVFPAFRYRCSDLQAACRIERRFPELGDRLSSAVAFATQREEDGHAGSSQLRRAVVTEVEAAVERLNLLECLDGKRTRRALAIALIGCAVITTLAFIDGPSVALSAKRILRPWRDEQWPRRHVLRFVAPPERLARGQDFEIELVDIRGDLPDRVEIHYWFDGDDESEVQSFEMQPLGDKLAHRLSNVAKPFRYRATGGDDQRMEWTRLDVLQPPKILLHEIKLIPPGYTEQPPYVSDGAIRAMVGSRATVRVRVDKRLSDAMLFTDTMSDGNGVPFRLDEDKKGFTLSAELLTPWSIQQSGVYSFRMVDVEGLESGESQSWDVDAVTDSPPTVSLTTPAANLLVTPRAEVRVQVLVTDDMGIRSIELRYSRSEDQGAEQTVSLLQGPAQATSREVSIANSATAAEMEETIDYVLDLEQIPGLKPGAWIDFTVVALDYKPQLGTSAARRLTLISPEQLDERLSQRQADILTQISEVARLQSETRSQVAGLRIQLEELQRLNRDDVDHLQSVELNQRQVSHRLGHPVDGVLSQIAELLAELKSNRVDNTEVHRRMAQVADVIRGLVDGPLPAVQQEFVKTLKIARDDLAERDSQSVASAATRESVLVAIGNAHRGQDQVVEALEKLLGEMSEWDSYRQLAREVGRLRREQKETRRQTEQLRLDTLALDLQAMSSAQRAEQRRLTERQSEISRNFDRLQSRMIEMRERLEEREPLAAATLRDAIEAAQNMALGGMLRDAGDQLRANRLGKATDRQSEIVDVLGHLQDLLANRRENTLDRVLGQLRDAAAELSELEKRQKDVRNRLEDPENHTDPALRELANKERDLAEQIQRLAARLERLQARQAGDMLQLATQALKDASVGAANGDVAAAQRNADLAADRMLRAQQQIQQSLGQTQQDLLREQLVRYQQLLTGVLQGQQSVLQDTQRLDRLRAQAPDTASPSWKNDTLQIAEEELELQQVVTALAGKLEDAQILGLVLQEVAESMSVAEERLRQLRTEVATQAVLQSTIDRLGQIVAALQTARDSAAGSQQGMPQQADDQRENAFLIAQLRILRELQESINERTRQLDQVRTQGQPLSEVQQQQQRDLAARQGHVARLLAELLKSSGAASPDRPDAKLDQLDQILDLD